MLKFYVKNVKYQNVYLWFGMTDNGIKYGFNGKSYYHQRYC